MNIYMILLLVLVFFLLNYIMNNKEILTENFGTDFFHRSFMTGLGLEDRKKALKKIYDFYGIKENFKGDTKIIDEMIESKKLDTKVVPKVDSKKPLFELEDLSYDDQKHIIKEQVKLSEYDEVEDYNTGSGDLHQIHEVFNEQEQKDTDEQLKMLSSRGGNVHIQKKE